MHKIFIDRFPFDYCRYKDTIKPGWFCGYKDGTYDRTADDNKALELTTRKAVALVNEMRDKGYNAYCLPPIPPPPSMAKKGLTRQRTIKLEQRARSWSMIRRGK